MPFNPNLILTPGTHVVTRVSRKVGGRDEPIPIGTVGVIEEAPLDNFHSYRVRFPDGAIASLKRDQFTIRRRQHEDALAERPSVLSDFDIYSEHVIYKCVVGSQAYGLAEDGSDCDRRGVFLPPAGLHWSLYGVPEQLEDQETEECYWELEKFLVLALKANPNILECLWTPMVEEAKPIARELLDMRESFLSKVVYQTYNGYVISQFKKLEQDLRNRGEIKLKHAMHLIRLLLSGVVALREKRIMVDVAEHRDRLLAIRRGETPWDEVNSWRLDLHKDFEAAFKATDLPDRPDYDRANDYLVRARRSMVVPQ
jgi:predicted nucleotidyltransferase